MSLLTAWVVIRILSLAAPSARWSRLMTWAVWSVAALSLLGLLQPTIAMLDAAALDLTPRLRISLYSVIKSALVLAVLLTLASSVTRTLGARIRTSRTLSASAQVLFTKTVRATLVGLAIFIGVHTLGIDLTAIAVLVSALGLGAGFGLQKVISNIVSGIVLLLDQSIRPGDVISVSGTYGWVTALGGRYVSVVTRDGVEHLIPNETLISERVENWTHTNSHTRLKIPVQVAYDTDVHRAIDICVQAACGTERVLAEPECRCLLVALRRQRPPAGGPHLDRRRAQRRPEREERRAAADLGPLSRSRHSRAVSAARRHDPRCDGFAVAAAAAREATRASRKKTARAHGLGPSSRASRGTT